MLSFVLSSSLACCCVEQSMQSKAKWYDDFGLQLYGDVGVILRPLISLTAMENQRTSWGLDTWGLGTSRVMKKAACTT